MRKLRALRPYLLRHRWVLLGGFLALVLTNYFQLRVPAIIGAATDAMKAQKAVPADYAWYASLILFYTALQGLFRYLMRQWIVGASRDIEFEFRNDIFRKLQTLTPSFYDRQRTGDLMSKATNDVDAVRMFLGPGILQFFNSVIVFPIALYNMIRISPWLTLISMAPLAVLPAIVNYYGNRVHRRFRTVQDHYSTISAMVQENLAGVRVVRAFVQEQPQQELFAKLNREFIELNLKLARVQAAFFPMLRVIAGVSVVTMLWIGGTLVIHHTISIGKLVEFSLIQLMLFWPMIALGWTISLMQRGAASMERIEEILELVPDVMEQPDTAHPGSVERGEIELRNLSFRYAPDLPEVLREITIHVNAGESLGVVGPTGSGKSTLAELLVHLYPIERGRLFIDGHDINDIPVTSLRDKVSMVFQETFLFSDTIGNNIAFHTSNGDDDSIRSAAEQAHIAPEIEEFPHGYGTMLGERGINLSGGQKQRTAIARALIRDPRILVLDDALSAVDTETERRIIANLREAIIGRTAVIVAHRISAVMHCNEIVVLSEGRIIERGTHDQLVQLGGLYASLYEKQLLTDAVETEGEEAS